MKASEATGLEREYGEADQLDGLVEASRYFARKGLDSTCACVMFTVERINLSGRDCRIEHILSATQLEEGAVRNAVQKLMQAKILSAKVPIYGDAARVTYSRAAQGGKWMKALLNR